jgi:hypothetical protein
LTNRLTKRAMNRLTSPYGVLCPCGQVCVGAACPEDRLHLLLPLLEAAGGKLLAPVDNDLRLYTRGPDGKLRQRVVSSVRFSDLEVRHAKTLSKPLV